MMPVPFHAAATPGGPADRNGSGGARRCAATPLAGACLAAVIAALGLGGCMDVSADTPAPPRTDDTVQVTADPLGQLSVVKVEMRPFRLSKSAVGQIGSNE